MIIKWDEIETMTPEQIENIRVECLKELQIMEDNHQIVKDNYLHVARDIMLLEVQKSDLKIAMGKSSNSIKSKKTDIDLLVSKFWQKKRI